MRSDKSTHPVQLVDVLFGAYRRQVLGLLLLRPGESFYVREIAAMTGVPVGSLHRELTLLSDAGLLLRSSVGNQVRYEADRTSPLYEELAGIFRKTSGLADVLRMALHPLARQIVFACIFGSVAQGKERASSDIDLLVVGPVSFEAVVEACVPAAKRLGREVNPVVATKTKLCSKLKEGDRFLSRIAREPKIVLIGDADELAKPAENRAA